MSRFAFFKESGWMLLAAIMAGVFTYLVHPVLTKPVSNIFDMLSRVVWPPLTKAEYGLFTTLMQVVTLINIPSNGLQSVVAQQTASVTSPEQERQLRGTLRALLAGGFVLWLVLMAITAVWQRTILSELKVYVPASLWVTLLIGLPVLCLPVLLGVLQGKQNFLWIGWQSIINAFCRVIAIIVIVRLVGIHVTGAMGGVFIGTSASLLICVWQAYPMLHGPADPVDWGVWLKRVLPLTLGLGASTFMLAADMLMVRHLFSEEESGLYNAAGIIGRALVFFTGPLSYVMFPKIVQAAARLERTDVMLQALGATALLGGGAALFCTMLPELPLRVAYSPGYLQIAPLVPWYSWAMVPVMLSNVLISNLLARQHFKAVPWLVGLAIAYGLTLFAISGKLPSMERLAAFKTIVLTFAAYSIAFLGISTWFTVRRR